MLRSARAITVLFLLAAFGIGGCMQDQIDANKQELSEQHAQLADLQREVDALKARTAANAYSTAPSAPGACDPAVMREATRKGGERMAAGEVKSAFGYYQDAVTACPQSAEAQLNLANIYETMGDRASAIAHYRVAASASGPQADAASVDKARAALQRFGG